MLIAIPLFGTRISPRFDCARSFLLAEVVDGTTPSANELSAGGWAPHDYPHNLAALGVEVLVAGGVDRRSYNELSRRGIKVYAWVTGEAQAALEGLAAGTLESGMTIGPDGCCRGRWRLGGGGGRGKRSGRGRRGA